MAIDRLGLKAVFKAAIHPGKTGSEDAIKGISPSDGAIDKAVSQEIEDLNAAVRMAKRSLRDGQT
jgi:hypothetical protein